MGLHSLAIITVAYQNYTVLDDFLNSLQNQSNDNFHLFISDLSDDKKPINEDLLKFNLTVNYGENLGYAHGVNMGIKNAINKGFNKFCIINDDTYFKDGFVEDVLQSLENHPRSIIGGKIYYAPGFEYHKTRYNKKDLGKVIWYAGGINDWDNVITLHQGVDEIDKEKFDDFKETDFVTGCLMCFDKKIIEKIGYWDEKYFLYYEDSDYCVRAKRKGISLYYDPSIVIWHKNAQSTEGAGSKIHQKYQKINRLKFGLKYAPLRSKFHLLKNYVLDYIR
ncbi:MAG: glycosyltransferase family 2 protein [Candidatus Roizmanbacteria bacterium]|nr:MAG: glycosyltransferase family 2 protein [Candidatus Roizmanbacteria bacterium]